MKAIYKILVPIFLKRWDTWLLENYPLVWRTRGHYVLYFALVLTPLLFLLGMAYPVSATNLTVNPVEQIVLFYDMFNISALVFLSVGILFWAYTQYQTGFPASRPGSVLLTLAIYAFCILIITGITAPAFRMGTIVRTAYFLIDKNDLANWEANRYFIYGYTIDEEKSVADSMPTDDYFRQGEARFAGIFDIEQRILDLRYDLPYMDSLHYLYLTAPNFTKKQTEEALKRDTIISLHSYRALPEYLIDASIAVGLSFRLYRLTAMDKPGAIYNQGRRDNNFLTYRFYRTFRLDTLDKSTRIYVNWSSHLPLYYEYYKKNRLNAVDIATLQKYGIPLGSFSLALDTVQFIRPAFPYLVEKAARSVRHAQQCMHAGIFSRHLQMLGFYLPMLAILLFAAPYFSFRHTLGALVVFIAGTILNAIFGFDERLSRAWYYWHSTAYLFIPAMGLLLLIMAALQRKRLFYVPFAFHLVLIGLVVGLFFALLGDRWIFRTDALPIGKPVDLAFFGVQLMGLTAALLMANLQALPKRA